MKLLTKSVRIKELFVIYHVKSLNFVKCRKAQLLVQYRTCREGTAPDAAEVMSSALSKKEEKQ